jgi:hypothetical protein
VRIRPASGGKRIAYPASPTRRPGIYEARVVFPRGGRWRYEIDDGFGGIHKFAPVTIGFGPPRRATEPRPEAPDPQPKVAEPSPNAAEPARGNERGQEDGSALWQVGVASLLLGTAVAIALVRRRNRARPMGVA